MEQTFTPCIYSYKYFVQQRSPLLYRIFIFRVIQKARSWPRVDTALAINMNPPQRSIVTALTRFGRERHHNGAKKQLNLALSEIICLFLVILPQRLHNGAKKVCILILNILRRRFFLNTHQINWQTQSHNPKSIVVLFQLSRITYCIFCG